MKEKDNENKENNNENLDIEIIMGDDSELNFSDIKDSIKSFKPKDKVKSKDIIIPKNKSENKENEQK